MDTLKQNIIIGIFAGNLPFPKSFNPVEDLFKMYQEQPDRQSQLVKYTEDLNAMHEAEKTLDKGQCDEYYHKLIHLKAKAAFGDSESPHECERQSWGSTAKERAEAFLKVIGKWEHN